MKTRLLVSLLAAARLAAPFPAPAQTSAQDSLANSVLTVTVVRGEAPFVTSGVYRIFTSVTGANYTMFGRAGPLSSGIYSYSKTSPTRGAAAFVDVEYGFGISINLSFASATNGAISLTNSTGFQTGTFTLAANAEPSQPQLFLPALAGGQFQSWLSGQPGFVYEIDASTNLANWQPWLNVRVADLTAGFSDAAGSGARFFRAWRS